MTTAELRDDRCRVKCSSTWHRDHGGALPGGPFPGTYGGPGDVRRCEHGKVWLFDGIEEGYFFTRHDTWRPISKWFEPRLYRRAVAVLPEVDDE